MHELDGVSPLRVFSESSSALFDGYLDPAPRGIWLDAFDADGRSEVDKIPTSTLYNIFLAFAEMVRVGEPD
jgi:hypothetical protein